MNLAELTIQHRKILDGIAALERHTRHTDERVKALHDLAVKLQVSSMAICEAIAQEKVGRIK